MDTFSKLVKLEVLELLKPTIKTKIFIYCEMKKINVSTGETILETMPFTSNIETILEFTNVNELYNEMIECIKENFASLNAKGSN